MRKTAARSIFFATAQSCTLLQQRTSGTAVKVTVRDERYSRRDSEKRRIGLSLHDVFSFDDFCVDGSRNSVRSISNAKSGENQVSSMWKGLHLGNRSLLCQFACLEVTRVIPALLGC